MSGRTIRVEIGGLRVASAPTKLVSQALGSCVAITMYDYKVKLGGMAHVMLPSSSSANLDGDRCKYVDTAVDLLLERILSRGAQKGRLVAKLAGGARMFAHRKDGRPDIGRRNVAAARRELKRLGVALAAEDVGGDFGRTVELSTQTGKLLVRSMGRRLRTL